MSKKLMMAGIGAVLALAVLPVQADLLIDKNFNAETVGSDSAYSFKGEPANSDIRVVDSSSTPADPFAGTGNRSLMMQDTGTGAPDIGWATAGFVNETQNMNLSLKAYITKDVTWADTYVSIQAGKNNVAAGSSLSSAEAAVQLVLQDDRIQVNSGGAFLQIDQAFAYNSLWDIAISIDVAAKTWTAAINGTALSDAGVSIFNFRNAVDGVNFISLTGQTTAASQRVFFDDIALNTIPEPATIGLFGISALIALVLRRIRA